MGPMFARQLMDGYGTGSGSGDTKHSASQIRNESCKLMGRPQWNSSTALPATAPVKYYSLWPPNKMQLLSIYQMAECVCVLLGLWTFNWLAWSRLLTIGTDCMARLTWPCKWKVSQSDYWAYEKDWLLNSTKSSRLLAKFDWCGNSIFPFDVNWFSKLINIFSRTPFVRSDCFSFWPRTLN